LSRPRIDEAADAGAEIERLLEPAGRDVAEGDGGYVGMMNDE
jgi:hypothetical protein